MIISASYRTDIPALYPLWFEARFAAGFCDVVNPYGGRPSRVALRDGVEAFVFWTRNASRFLPALDQVAAADIPFMVQYGLTAYPRALERAVPAAPQALALMRGIFERFGPRCLVWRYDPIVLTSLTDGAWHRENFARLATALAGSTDEVVTSFAQPYRKTARNLDIAARQAGFSWRMPESDEKTAIIGDLSAIAGEQGMRLTLCTQPDLKDAAPSAACIDLERLADIAGRPLPGRLKGNRPGCLCAESRDIGAYDSCPQGCAYCYAVSDQETAKKRVAAHRTEGSFLIDPPPSGRKGRAGSA